MATFASSLTGHPPTALFLRRRFLPPSVSLLGFNPTTKFGNHGRLGIRVSASSSSNWVFSAGDENSESQKSALYTLIRDIEPLDVSLIQKDVSNTTIDAMKRTISGMLGLLPSDQFQVTIDALWEPLSKLLISSMMTGYTLRNADYRLSLERNLEIHEGNKYNLQNEDSKLEVEEIHLKEGKNGDFGQERMSSDESEDSTCNIPDFGEMTPEARRYILRLYSRITSVKGELHAVKRKSEALQMQQFVGEEKNDLLDYLRSLQPEKVAELSEPTSPELKYTIHSVVHGLLATLSPKMHSKGPDPGNNNSTVGTVDAETKGDCIDLVENTSLQYQPLISLPRDYLARLLFWCMLLGHFLRGLEYRLELMDLLSLPCSGETNTSV